MTNGIVGVTVQGRSPDGALAPYPYWEQLFADASNMGLTWIRFQKHWRNIELSPGNYTWTVLDDAVAQCNAAGINLLLTLEGAPSFALTTASQKATSEPWYLMDPTLTANFASAIVSRYNGGAHGHVDALGFNEEFNIHYTPTSATFTLSSTITPGGGPYTTLSINAAKQTADVGTLIYLGGYSNTTDVATISSAVAVGDTTVHISSFTPATTYSSGATLNVAYVATHSSPYDLYDPGADGVTPAHRAQPARNARYGAAVFNAVAPAVRAVNPTIPLGLPLTWWVQPQNPAAFPNSPSNVTAYIQTLYDRCAANIIGDPNVHMDGHYYTGPVSPTTGSPGTEDILSWVNDFQTVAAANGDAGRALWMTEFGWRVPKNADAVTQANRFQTVLSAIIPPGNPNNNKALFYTLDYTPTGSSGSSLVNTDGSHQPAYAIVKNFIAANSSGGGPPPPPPPTTNLGITVGGGDTTFDESSFKLSYKLDERWRAQFTALDYAGTTTYSYGEQVRITDALLGRLFTGFVATDSLDKGTTYPDKSILHQLDCMGNEYRADKRTTNRLYTSPTYAGQIVTDMVDDVLAAEGVVASYAKAKTTTRADFAQGTLSGVVATYHNDGDLELIYSGKDDEIVSSSDWKTRGTSSHLLINRGGDVTLNAVTRDWNNGVKSNQTLYGPSAADKIIGSGDGINRYYGLVAGAQSTSVSRLDFAGTWADATVQVDMHLDANEDVSWHSLTYRTTTWNNRDNTYAYAVELSPSAVRLTRGSNSATGSETILQTTTFSQPLSHGWYTVLVAFSGNSHTVSVNGKQYLSVTDGTYTAAGYVALRHDNQHTSGSQTLQFDNFGVAESLTATWTQSTGVSLSSIASVVDSQITWGDALSTGSASDYTILVQVSCDGGTTYKHVNNGGVFPQLPPGTSGSGLSVKVKVTLSTTTLVSIPHIFDVAWVVSGGYNASGTRTSIPPAVLGTDTITRADQSGWGTASDGQPWYFDDGAGTLAIVSNEGNVSGDNTANFIRLGTSLAGESNLVVRLAFGGNADAAGIYLRASTTTNCYRCTISATALTIECITAGTATTLATLADTYLSGTYYQVRFAALGTSLSANAWLDGTDEPDGWMLTTTDTTYTSGQYGLYAGVGQGGAVTPLTLYGTNSAASTLSTAGLLVNVTGASSNGQRQVQVGTSTGYGEIVAFGSSSAWPAAGSLGAASGNGWLYDVTDLEQQQLIAGTSTPSVRARISAGVATADMYVRLYKRASGGAFTLIGTCSLPGQTLTTSLAHYTFPGNSFAATSFSTGEKLYLDMWFNITSNSSGSSAAVVGFTMSNNGGLGRAQNAELDTPGSQALHSTINFDHFSALTQGVTPGLDLSPVGILGTSAISWNALLPTNTSLGVDVSLDRGNTWTEVTNQNGEPIPGLNGTPEPTVDDFLADSSSNYVSAYGAGGAPGAFSYDVANKRLVATDGSNAVYLFQDITRANIDVLTDMDYSDAGGLVWCYSDANNYYSLVVADNQAALGTPNTLSLYRQASISTPNLTFYATTTAAQTIITARKSVHVLGATTTAPVSSKCGTATGYSEMYSSGNTSAWAAAGSLNAPSGHGFLVDNTHLEGQTLPLGDWAPMVRAKCSIGSLTADMYVRAYVYHTGSGTYTQIGSTMSLTGQSVTTTPTNFQFGNTSMPAVTFAVGDRFYFDISFNITANATGSSSATVSIVEANGQTQGHRNACQIATSISQPIPQVLVGQASINFIRNTYHRIRATTSYGAITVSFDGDEAITYTDPAPLPAGNPGLYQNGNATSGGYAQLALGPTVSYILNASSYMARFYELWMQPLGDDMTNVIVDTRLRLATTDPTVTPQVYALTVAAYDPHIGNGALIPGVDYRRTFCSKNLDDLTKKSGDYSWNIDQFNALNFHHRQVNPAPWILQSSTIDSFISDLEVDSTLAVEVSGDLYRNRQVLKGVTNVGQFTDTFVGDGSRTSFTLRYPLAEITKPIITLSVDNVKQSVGLKGTTNHDWYYAPGDGTIAQDNSGTVLTSTDTLKVVYDGIFSDTVTVDNTAAQAALAAVAGGTGIVEDVQDVSNPGMLYDAAVVYANQLLARYCVTGRTVNFTTYRDGLQVGMALAAYVPEEGLYGAQLLIHAIDVTVQTQPNNTRLYKYSVQASELPPLHSWQKLLASGLLT